jgi:hypothetical protein
MIRAALALTAGLIFGSIAESRLIRAVRRWFIRTELRLALDEIVDTCDDIADAMHDGDWLLAEGLTEFYTQLCNHRDELRKRHAELL